MGGENGAGKSISDREVEMGQAKFEIEQLEKASSGVQEAFFVNKNHIINEIKGPGGLSLESQIKLLGVLSNGGDLDKTKEEIIAWEKSLRSNQMPKNVDLRKMDADFSRASTPYKDSDD